MKTTIVIPTYNEKDNIDVLVEEILTMLPEVNILVVDDNSPDGTADKVVSLMNKFPNLNLLRRPFKNGLGGAYIEGFQQVLKDGAVEKVIMMDADGSHDPKYLSLLLRESRNYDLVIGSRYINQGGIDRWELWRRVLSGGGNFYVRLLLGRLVCDWTGGFNCINARLLDKIDFSKIDLSGYAFIMGLKYSLVKAGARVKEIPIIFKARRGGESKISRHIISEGITAPWKIILKI